MDIETPIKTRQKDDRVCSTHFDKDDFTIPKRAADPKNPKRVSLKRNAIPRVQQVATDRLEVKLFAYLSCYMIFHNWCGGGRVIRTFNNCGHIFV